MTLVATPPAGELTLPGLTNSGLWKKHYFSIQIEALMTYLAKDIFMDLNEDHVYHVLG